MASNSLAYAQERRSTRIDEAIPITVQGADAFRAPYQERVSTISISCHGCKYRTKYEVIPGDIVCLELNDPSEGRAIRSTRARVKWQQRLQAGRETSFEVAVELESPGNVWGIAAPPQDWLTIQKTTVFESAKTGQELRVVPRPERELVTLSDRDTAPELRLERNDTPSSLSPFLAQLMVGLGEQIQVMASEAATSVILKEKSRMLEEFRGQLQNEAETTLARAIQNSKQHLAAQAVKELSEAHENSARIAYERWRTKIEQDVESTVMRIVACGTETNERVDGMALGTIERLQQEMDTSRRNAMEQTLLRIRNQLTPLLGGIQTALQKLAASEDELKVKSLSICKQFEEFLLHEADKSASAIQEKIDGLEKQFDSAVSDRLISAHDRLNATSAGIIDQSTQTLLKIAQDREEFAQAHLESLATAATDRTLVTLKTRAEEIARQCSSQVETDTRSHLEFISQLIAEIAKKKPGDAR